MSDTFTVIVRRFHIEEHILQFEADTAMEAFDQAQAIVNIKNSAITNNHYSIVQIKKEENING